MGKIAIIPLIPEYTDGKLNLMIFLLLWLEVQKYLESFPYLILGILTS